MSSLRSGRQQVLRQHGQVALYGWRWSVKTLERWSAAIKDTCYRSQSKTLRDTR